MPLVAPGLDPLGEPVVAHHGNGMPDRAHPLPVLEVLHGPLDLAPVVAEDPGGEHTGDGRQIPVGPVVGDDGVVVMAQEAVTERQEDVRQQLLRPPEIEVTMVTHEFRGVGELIAVQPRGQEPVGRALDRGQLPRPGVQDRHGGVGVRVLTADVIPQGVLVGGVDVVVEGRVVLGRPRPPVHRRLRIRLPAALRVPVGGELGEPGRVGLGARLHLGRHSVQVGPGVQQPRVGEGGVGGGGRGSERGRTHTGGARRTSCFQHAPAADLSCHVVVPQRRRSRVCGGRRGDGPR